MLNLAGVCTRIGETALGGDWTGAALLASEPAAPKASPNEPAVVACIVQVKLAAALAPMSFANGAAPTVVTTAVPDCGMMLGSTLSAAASPVLVARIVTLKVWPTFTSAGIALAETESWALDAPVPAPACRSMDSDFPVSSAAITTEDAGTVSITSFATFRRAGGVVLSNLGVVGAQLAHFSRTSDAVVQAELAAYRPDLVVLAFGTNEGFSAGLALDAYEEALRTQIARIRRLAGADVPILLLGPPDAATRIPASAGLAGACGDGWAVPLGLEAVRARQQRVARAMHAAFWNWSAAMGGRCASSSWRMSDAMRGDHVHFTRSGGDRIGAMIDADMIHALELLPSPDGASGGRR